MLAAADSCLPEPRAACSAPGLLQERALCAGCVGCWLVSVACCGVAGFVCCARSNGAEQSPAINKVLRILVIRYCTVIKTSGKVWFSKPTWISRAGYFQQKRPGCLFRRLRQATGPNQCLCPNDVGCGF